MNSPEKKNQLDHCFLDSLLREAMQGETADDEKRIQSFMASMKHETEVATDVSDAIEPAGQGNDDRKQTVRTRTPSRKWYARGLAIALALAVLVALFISLQVNDPSRKAHATIRDCLVSMEKEPNRKYTIKMTRNRLVGGTFDIDSTLYLDDKNNFVLRYPNWTRMGYVWIGGSPTERWLVAERGPVLIGDAKLMGKWLFDKGVDTPYLNLKSLLEKMPKAYDLELVGAETLTIRNEGKDVQCKHVRGYLRAGHRRQLPQQIDLWASLDHGDVQKLVLDWQRPDDEPGPTRWEFELVGHPDLKPDWFSHEGHVDGKRRTIRVKRIDEIRRLGDR